EIKNENQALKNKLALAEELLKQLELEQSQKLAAQIQIPPKD
ncbi:26080_t:CDS:1, partial [Racocetra persica]